MAIEFPGDHSGSAIISEIMGARFGVMRRSPMLPELSGSHTMVVDVGVRVDKSKSTPDGWAALPVSSP